MAEDQSRTLTDKFMLRLPDGMRERIKAAAAANGRSMNAEIVAQLDAALKFSEETGHPVTADGLRDFVIDTMHPDISELRDRISDIVVDLRR
ncbi:MAG: Arc family DNA-binding protein [Pseudomonadota bacterium]